MAAITGTKLLLAGVKRYSTLGGTVPKSLHWIKPTAAIGCQSKPSHGARIEAQTGRCDIGPGSQGLGMQKVATTGNATIIVYDGTPLLATDPWIGDEEPAYFGSWVLSHRIPQNLKDDIAACPYIWFSHGHPDHLNPTSIERFKGKKILLADHVGSRIHR